MFTRFKQAAIAVMALILAVTPSLVSACGGFFGPADLSVDLNAFRAVFSVGKDDQVTEIVGVKYTGTAADFSWVFPLPAIPTVDVANQSDLDVLQAATDPRVTFPVDYCAELNQSQGFGGGGGFAVTGTVGPYDYAIIKNDQPGKMIKWLRDHGYTIKASDEPILSQYVKEGNTFVALRLKPEADVQDIQPVVFHYQSRKITIPVRLGAVASSANVPVLIWIFGESQYGPTNYKRVDRPSLSATRSINEVLSMDSLNPPEDEGVNPPYVVYDEGVKAIQRKYRGHAFITEFAGPTKDLQLEGNRLADAYRQIEGDTDAVLQTMVTSFPYVTRLHAQLSPEQMTLDPLFAPITGTADVPRVVDLGKVVDPLTLYGCTTKEALEPRIASEFATSHTTFNDLQFDVGHPADWVLSKFTLTANFSTAYSTSGAQPTLTVYAFAPQPVTAQTLDTYFKGGETPPMFVFTKLGYRDPEAFWEAAGDARKPAAPTVSYTPESNRELNALLLEALGRDGSHDNLFSPTYIAPVEDSFWPYPVSTDIAGDWLILFGILANRAQWQASQSLFWDMLAYGRAHQYFTGADTKDTLFLRVFNSDGAPGDVYMLPIPNGWTAQFDINNDILIAANPTASDGPAMRLTLVGHTENAANDVPGQSRVDAGSAQQPYPTDTVQRLLGFYGLPGSPNDKAFTDVLQNCSLNAANPVLKPNSFHSGGRTGLVVLTNEYIAGVYAPDADFNKYQATLQKLMNAYVAGYTCGTGSPSYSNPSNGTATPGVAVTATAVICPKSPAPRLVIGGQGRVTPGTPDNLRQVPNGGAPILLQIPIGGQFTVLKGPVCDPRLGLAWWQVQYQGQTGWLAEGQGQTYFAEPVPG